MYKVKEERDAVGFIIKNELGPLNMAQELSRMMIRMIEMIQNMRMRIGHSISLFDMGDYDDYYRKTSLTYNSVDRKMEEKKKTMNCQLIQRELVKVVQLSISDIGYYSIKKYKQDKIKPVHDTVIILEDQQDLWIELSTQETSEKVQLILNKAIQKLSHSVKIWLNDGNKEQEKLMLKFNYYKEPLNLFLIVQIFGMNLLVYQVNKKQLQYSYVKQLNIFLRIYHFC